MQIAFWRFIGTQGAIKQAGYHIPTHRPNVTFEPLQKSTVEFLTFIFLIQQIFTAISGSSSNCSTQKCFGQR